MMRRMSQLATRSLFAVVLVPFAIAACDQMKKDAADAAVPVATVPTAATATATATATDTATAAPTATPLTATATVAPTATTTTTAVPTAKTDGGVAPKPDGGAAPAATPTFQIPTAIPGFDAGAWKPPAGFPSTLPTFPPPKQ